MGARAGGRRAAVVGEGLDSGAWIGSVVCRMHRWEVCDISTPEEVPETGMRKNKRSGWPSRNGPSLDVHDPIGERAGVEGRKRSSFYARPSRIMLLGDRGFSQTRPGWAGLGLKGRITASAGRWHG